MDVREKLVELLNEVQETGVNEIPAGFGCTIQYITNERVASHLISNGVTVQEQKSPCSLCGYGGKHLDAPPCTKCPAHPKEQSNANQRNYRMGMDVSLLFRETDTLDAAATAAERRMIKMGCRAKENGKVPRRGEASIEWYKEGKPQYYCYGYIDKMTDELLPECKKCRSHVSKAQDDIDEYNRRKENDYG